MRVKKVLYGITVLPLILILTLVEWLLKLLVKISTVAAGLLINVLWICVFIAICTRQWTSLGILTLCVTIVLLFVYAEAVISYIISEIREFADSKRKYEG